MWNQGSNAQHNEHFGQGHQESGNAAYPAQIRGGAYEEFDGASHGYNGTGAHVDYAEREYPERGDPGLIRGLSHIGATGDLRSHQVYISGHEIRNYGEHPDQSGYEYGQSGPPDRGYEGQRYEYINQPGYDSCTGQAQYGGYTTQYPAEASYGYPEIKPSRSQSTGMTDTANTAALREGEERAGLQKLENETAKPETMSKPPINAPAPKPAVFSVKKNPSNEKAAGPRLAFGFKSASKVKATVNPLKAALETDEQEREEAERKEEAERDAKRQKLGIAPPVSEAAVRAPSAPPPAPVDPEVRQIAEKLAKFVAKNGRGLENTTRQRNPGDTPFRFLFDPSSSDYKYYDYCIALEEKAIQEGRAGAQVSQEASRPSQPPPVQTQSQPLERRRTGFTDAPLTSRAEPSGVSSSQDDKLSQEDSLAKMEFYARQAARANAVKEPKADTREMPPAPDTNRDVGGPPRRGHHMGDFIPDEELQSFLAKTTPGGRAPPSEDRNKIGASNVGHKLLSKMGWTEGSGLGAGGSGMVDPLAAGGAKLDGLGVGAAKTHEPSASDDIYEQYKKRMMLGYKHRPNPLGNPRKAYY